jgi:hypothetical protein
MIWGSFVDAGDLHVRFDERDVETELWQGYLGTARRKGRQQTTLTYDHRATSRLYRPLPNPGGCVKFDRQIAYTSRKTFRAVSFIVGALDGVLSRVCP